MQPSRIGSISIHGTARVQRPRNRLLALMAIVVATSFGATSLALAGIGVTPGSAAGTCGNSDTFGALQMCRRAATIAGGTFAVSLLPQTISFTGPGEGAVGGSATLSATGGASGNPVVFSVDAASGSGVCNVTDPNGSTLN